MIFMKDITFSFLDLETTGIDPISERIVEVGLVKVRNNEIIEEYSQLVNPKQPMSAYVTQLTGIKPVELLSAPTFDEIADELEALLADSLLVAHNVRFDYSFLEAEYSRLVKPFDYPYLCSVKLSRYLYPEHVRHGLDAIMNRFDIACSDRHRAFDDAKVIHEFFQKSQEKLGDGKMLEGIMALSQKTKGKDLLGSPRLI